MHHELKPKVVDLFDTGYTDEYGLRELVEKAANALADIDLMREKRLVKKLMDEIRKPDGGLSIYGEQVVLDAVKDGVIDTLLISEGLRKNRVTYKCLSCGQERNLLEVREFKPERKKVEKEVNCLKCKASMSLQHSEDVIETLSKLADEVGTKVELISDDSAEGDMLLKAFSGLAGILRYKIAG